MRERAGHRTFLCIVESFAQYYVALDRECVVQTSDLLDYALDVEGAKDRGGM